VLFLSHSLAGACIRVSRPSTNALPAQGLTQDARWLSVAPRINSPAARGPNFPFAPPSRRPNSRSGQSLATLATSSPPSAPLPPPWTRFGPSEDKGTVIFHLPCQAARSRVPSLTRIGRIGAGPTRIARALPPPAPNPPSSRRAGHRPNAGPDPKIFALTDSMRLLASQCLPWPRPPKSGFLRLGTVSASCENARHRCCSRTSNVLHSPAPRARRAAA